ncbi:MAG: ferritin-like domain-containing protein [bacterium]
MSTEYHEPVSELSADAREIHRALASLIEELQAVDWYHQRVDVSSDEELAAILIHNRDEEIEHATMTLEWLRRRIPKFDEELRTYLFTDKPITKVENAEEQGGEPSQSKERSGGSDLGIGKFEKGETSS